MSDGINNRILIIKGILAEKCGLDPDLYDEIEDIFNEIQILDKAKDDALKYEREQKQYKQQSNCDLPHVSVSLLSDLPENKPLYKDSGLWQLRSDDMDEVIIQQHSEESDEAFLEKCREIQREKERNER